MGCVYPTFPASGFQADWPLFFAYALAGDCVMVSRVLYRKRMWSGSVTAGWSNADLDESRSRRGRDQGIDGGDGAGRPHRSPRPERRRVYQAILARPALSAFQLRGNKDPEILVEAEADWLDAGLPAFLDRLLTGKEPTERPRS